MGEEQAIEKEPLDINKLIDKPLNELTEEEAAFVIDYKAAIKARDDAYMQRQAELREHMQALAAIHGEMAAKAEAQLEALTAHAIEAYKVASNG